MLMTEIEGDDDGKEHVSTFPPTPYEYECETDLLKSDKTGLPLAVLDLDKTFFRPKTGNVIILHELVQYIHEHRPNLTIGAHREKIFRIFSDWEAGDIINYDQLIKESSDQWARSLEGVETETFKKEVSEWVSNFISSTTLNIPESRFFGYTGSVMKMLNDTGLTKVFITGAPEEVLPPIRKLLEVPFSFGMRVEQKDGKYTGNSRFTSWAGQTAAKDSICKELVKRGHSIVFGMGDSGADAALISAAIESRATHDLYGAGLIVNANERDRRGFETYRVGDTRSGFLEIEDDKAETAKVARIVRDLVSEALCPTDPVKMSRNGKKLRDLYFNMGFDQGKIEKHMISLGYEEEFVREIVGKKMTLKFIDAFMKERGLNFTEVAERIGNGEVCLDKIFQQKTQK